MPERELQQLTDDFQAAERKIRHRAAISELIRNGAIVMLIIFVWAAMYAARRYDTSFSRAGCVRGAVGYLTNAGGWVVAAGVRRAEGDDGVAREYQRRANRLIRLAGVGPESVRAFRESEAKGEDIIAHPPQEIVEVCRQRFPEPSFFVLQR